MTALLVLAAFKPVYLIGVAFILLTIYIVGITLRGEPKKCPECAESVKKDAKVCKHCGYRFG